MAIKRISDLPNVETVTDGNPNIASCLFEVSHRDAEDHNVFKSYYMTGIDVANQVYNDERLSNCVKLSCYPAQTISVAHNFSKGFYLVDTSHPVNNIIKTPNELTNTYSTKSDALITPASLLPYLTDTYVKLSANHVQKLSSALNFSTGFYLVDTSHPVNAILKTPNELSNTYSNRNDVIVTPASLLPYLADTYMKVATYDTEEWTFTYENGAGVSNIKKNVVVQSS